MNIRQQCLRIVAPVLVAICTVAAMSFEPSEAATFTFFAPLSGANENPATGSPGTGSAQVIIDDVANTMEVNVTFSGLTTNDVAALFTAVFSRAETRGWRQEYRPFPGFLWV
jgi:hypothetical protein